MVHRIQLWVKRLPAGCKGSLMVNDLPDEFKCGVNVPPIINAGFCYHRTRIALGLICAEIPAYG